MVKIKKHTLSSGTEIFIGRDSKTNDELVRTANPDDILIHTIAPGSPFVNVGENPSNQDLNMSSATCVVYSQSWRDSKANIPVNIFSKKDMNKNKNDKEGTWNVKKSKKKIVKKSDILKYEKILKETNETN